jgi:uroporphyrinogen-III synthase
LSKLLDKKILAITRRDLLAKEFSDLVRSEGGKVIALPTIDIIPKDPKLVEELIETITKKNHDFCVFMSPNAVDILFDLACKIKKADKLISVLNSRIIIAIGPKTRNRLIHYKIKVKIVPENYSSEGLIQLFASNIDLANGKRIIIPRSGESDEFIKISLLALGMESVDEIHLYAVKTSQTENSIWKEFIVLLMQKKIDSIVFTSSSTVKAFFRIIKDSNVTNVEQALDEIKAIIAIGPRTGEELQKRRIRNFVAEEHTIKGAFELAKLKLLE